MGCLVLRLFFDPNCLCLAGYFSLSISDIIYKGSAQTWFYRSGKGRVAKNVKDITPLVAGYTVELLVCTDIDRDRCRAIGRRPDFS